ncbi:MAG: choice-of-anchor Q domain-containing protein [Planctomycetota bacterium]
MRLCFTMGVLFVSGAACGDVIGVPGDFATIQAAIDSASDGDVIEIAPGTYHEVLDTKGLAIELRSTGSAADTIIDAGPLPIDPTIGKAVIRCVSGEGRDTVIRGLTITGGTGEGASPTFGGGLYLGFGAPTVIDCVIVGNSADQGAGALVLGTIFESVLIDSCRFVNNHASFVGGGIQASGHNGTLEIRDSVFESNTAGDSGGGASLGLADVNGSVFLGNSAAAGGGVVTSLSSVARFVRTRFLGNSATTTNPALGGGAAANRGAPNLYFESCAFSGNTSASRGGAILLPPDGLVTLNACTIAGNDAAQFAGALHSQGPVELWATSCLVWDNSTGGVIGPASDISGAFDADSEIRYAILQGAAAIPPEVSFSGIVTVIDPMFADPIGPDGVRGTLDDDLRLLPGSPAIDAGDSIVLPLGLLDAAGDLRGVDDPDTEDTGVPAFGVIVDLGAHEYQVSVDQSADVTTTGATLVGQPGFGVPDGTVDLDDLGFFLNLWLMGAP